MPAESEPDKLIYVVEDDADLAQLLRTRIADVNPDIKMRVRAFNSFEETAQALRTEIPDAVLLNPNLPDYLGIHLFDRQDDGRPLLKPQSRVVVVTGGILENEAVEFREHGVMAIIPKPDIMNEEVLRSVTLQALSPVNQQSS